MKILFTGRGTAGSWQIRGNQLAHALGASVTMSPDPDYSATFDHLICVKKPPTSRILRSGYVWDIVDAWPQPLGNNWERHKVINFIRTSSMWHNAKAIICATDKMRQDLDDGSKPMFTLYHHHRPKLDRNPIREKLEILGYEGDPKYLGKWHDLIIQECKKRGLHFHINPHKLISCDILLAFRDFPHKGYATDNWKSNVKLANAQGSGTPIICSGEAGYKETDRGGVYYADEPRLFSRALDILTPQTERMSTGNRLYKGRYSVDEAAEDLKGFLQAL